MKHFSFCLAVLFLSSLLPTAGSAQRKVGYIDMDDLVAIMRETRQAQQALKSYGDSLSRIEGGLQQEFVTKRDAFFQDSASMDTATREVHRRVLQSIIRQEGEFRAEAKAQLDSVQQVLRAAVAAKAEEAVLATAKANGYAYVFRKIAGAYNQQEEFIIIGPEKDDLLPQVKKQLGLETR